jgi:hypothetical protein
VKLILLFGYGRNSKPVYKELSVWPTTNLDFEAGGCPFAAPKLSEKKPQHTAKQTKEENEAKDAALSTKHPLDTARFVYMFVPLPARSASAHFLFAVIFCEHEECHLLGCGIKLVIYKPLVDIPAA